MMVNCQYHLRAKDLLPEDIEYFRFNSTTRKDYISFVNHSDAMSLVTSIDNIATTPPVNSGLVDNFKVAYSPAKSIKILLKDMQVFLIVLKKGSIGILGVETPFPLLEHRT